MKSSIVEGIDGFSQNEKIRPLSEAKHAFCFCAWHINTLIHDWCNIQPYEMRIALYDICQIWCDIFNKRCGAFFTVRRAVDETIFNHHHTLQDMSTFVLVLHACRVKRVNQYVTWNACMEGDWYKGWSPLPVDVMNAKRMSFVSHRSVFIARHRSAVHCQNRIEWHNSVRRIPDSHSFARQVRSQAASIYNYEC